MSQQTSSTSGTKEVCEAFIKEAQDLYGYITYQLYPIDPAKNLWSATITYEQPDS